MNKKHAKVQSTGRSLALSILSLVLCVAMLIGTTYAWFTDSVTSGKNKIVAGNLDIDVKHTNAKVTTAESINGKTNLFYDINGNEMLWEPGAVSFENFTVENLGTLAFKYNLALAVADYNAVSGTGKTLKDILKVKVLTGDKILSSVTRDAVMKLDWTTSDSIDAFKKDNGTLYPAGTTGKASTEAFQVIIYWEPTENDNDWNVNNGKTTTDGQPLFIEFGVNVVAAQLKYESDSFGDDYDADTILPTLPKSINKEFKSAPISGKTYEGTESVEVINKNESNATVASVPAAAVKAIVEEMAKDIDIKDGTDVNTVLTLSIKTNEISETKASYSIDLTATMTYTDTTGAAQQKDLTASEVDALLGSNIVTATVNIGANLVNVSVKHAGADMEELNSAEADAEGFFYSKSDGILTIKTCSFSPFDISFEIPEKVKELEVDGKIMSLADFRDSVNAGTTYEGKTVKLLADIDLGGEEWTPIGDKDNNKPFKGIFDGDNHVISNMKITEDASYTARSGGKDGALFNYVVDGTVKNLTVNGTITNVRDGAGIVYIADGNVTLSGLTSNVEVTARRKAGGIVCGASHDQKISITISDCMNNGKVEVTTAQAGNYVGGIVANINYKAKITNCINNGDIKIAGASQLGGIVGQMSSGGAVSDTDIEVIDCVNNGDMYSSGANVGGLVGRLFSGSGQNVYQNGGRLFFKNFTNTGNVVGEYTIFGGVIGGGAIPDTEDAVNYGEGIFTLVAGQKFTGNGNYPLVKACVKGETTWTYYSSIDDIPAGTQYYGLDNRCNPTGDPITK